MRARSLLVAAVAAVTLAGPFVAVAGASKSEAGGSEVTINLSGHDWVGPVRVGYTLSVDRHNRERADAHISTIVLANECDPRGSRLTAFIAISRDERFSYTGHGWRVSGTVVGPRQDPRELYGTATARTGTCTSGPWWFEVR